MQAWSIVITLKSLLNTQVMRMVVIKTMMSKIELQKRKISIVFDDMIADFLSKKIFSQW